MNGYSDVNSGLGELISNLLSQVSPELAPLLGPMIHRQVMNRTGFAGGPMASLSVSNDMTMSGAMFSHENQQYAEASAIPFSRMAAEARRRAMRQTIGMITSEEAYNKANQGNKSALSYSNYLDQRVQEEEGNFFSPYKLGYSMLDPYGMSRAQPYMIAASTNIMRAATGRGDSWGMSNARRLMSGMFRDKDGRYDFRPENYGGMQIDSVSAIMAALTKDFDPTANVKAGNATQLKQASDAFSKMVSEYSKALAPLKDVFGKDFPSMIEALQTMSGQSLSSMGSGKAERLALSLANNIQANGYSIEQVMATDAVMKRQMTAAGAGGLAALNTSELSLRALNAATGNGRPPTMSKDDFANYISNVVVKTAASEGAEKLNLAYGLWEDQNKGKSFAEFSKLVEEKAARDKTSSMQAALSLTGKQNMYELEAGRYTRGFVSSTEQGQGQAEAMKIYYKENLHAAAVRARADSVGQAAIQKEVGGEVTADDMQRYTTTAMDALVKDPKIANMDTMEKRYEAILSQLRATGKYEGDEAGLRREATAVNLQLHRMMYDDRYKNQVAVAVGRGNTEEAAARAKRVADATADVRALNVNGGTWLNLVMEAIDKGDNDKIAEMIGDRTFAGMTPEGKKDFITATKALAQIAPVGDDKARKEFLKAHGANLTTYAASAEGRSNSYYQAAMAAYRSKGTPENANAMLVASMLGDDAIKQWGVSVGHNGTEMQLLRRLSQYKVDSGSLESQREKLASMMARDVALQNMQKDEVDRRAKGGTPVGGKVEADGKKFLSELKDVENLTDDQIRKQADDKYGKGTGEYVIQQLKAARTNLGVSETKLSGAKDWTSTIAQLEGIVKMFSMAVEKLTGVTNNAPGTVVVTQQTKKDTAKVGG